MSIPKILEMEDTKILKTMTYKLIGKTKNGLLIYENIKTGCKQCFHENDFIERENQKRWKTKYE